MNNDTDTSFPTDAFIPVLILAISYIILMGWQISNVSSQRRMMENASTRQEQPVIQSHQAQAALQKLASDLLQTAQNDDTARAIVTKFGIQQNGGAPQSASPAPSK